MINAPHRSAFSLAEVALALSIATLAIISVLALLPTAMETSRLAISETVVGIILDDAKNRIQGQQVTTANSISFGPFFYDDHGNSVSLSENSSHPQQQIVTTGQATFRVDASYIKFNTGNQPENAGGLYPITMQIYSPISNVGAPLKKDSSGKFKPVKKVTFYGARLTGNEWESLDKSYIPRIEL